MDDQRVEASRICQKWTVQNLEQFEVASARECNSSARWPQGKLWE